MLSGRRIDTLVRPPSAHVAQVLDTRHSLGVRVSRSQRLLNESPARISKRRTGLGDKGLSVNLSTRGLVGLLKLVFEKDVARHTITAFKGGFGVSAPLYEVRSQQTCARQHRQGSSALFASRHQGSERSKWKWP